MGKKEPSDIGKQIEDLVQDAIDKLDFDQLSNNIEKAVGKWNQELETKVKPSIDQMKEEVLRATDSSRSIVSEQLGKVKDKWNVTKTIKNAEGRNLTVPVNNRSSLKVKGVLYTVFSSIGMGIFGIITLIAFLFPKIWLFAKITTGVSIVCGILTFVCFVFLSEGIDILKKHNRMLRYIQLLKKKGYIEIQELERYMGIKKKRILKEVKEMLSLGILPEGHLDQNQTYLIGTNEIYEQYRNTEEELKKRQQEEVEKEARKRELSDTEKAILAEIEEGKAQVAEIRRLNDALPEPIVSEKLYRLENISEKIFLYVEKHPEQMEEIRRLKNYYLPTMLKLVTAYHKLKQEEIESENINKMCMQIEETLDTMNSALEYMYDELYADEALDVATDISVLKTMLAREGLVRNEFENAKEDKNYE